MTFSNIYLPKEHLASPYLLHKIQWLTSYQILVVNAYQSTVHVSSSTHISFPRINDSKSPLTHWPGKTSASATKLSLLHPCPSQSLKFAPILAPVLSLIQLTLRPKSFGANKLFQKYVCKWKHAFRGSFGLGSLSTRSVQLLSVNVPAKATVRISEPHTHMPRASYIPLQSAAEFTQGVRGVGAELTSKIECD